MYLISVAQNSKAGLAHYFVERSPRKKKTFFIIIIIIIIDFSWNILKQGNTKVSEWVIKF